MHFVRECLQTVAYLDHTKIMLGSECISFLFWEGYDVFPRAKGSSCNFQMAPSTSSPLYTPLCKWIERRGLDWDDNADFILQVTETIRVRDGL